MKLTGMLWWIDRWRKSTAYTDLTLAEQGAYRNLLDEAWLRGGPLPDDDRILAKACGDATAWFAIRQRVRKKFVKKEGKLRNATLDDVFKKVSAVSDARKVAGKRGAAIRWGNGKTDSKPNSKRHNKNMGSGSGSGSDLYVRTAEWICPHVPRCPDRSHCAIRKRRKAGL